MKTKTRAYTVIYQADEHGEYDPDSTTYVDTGESFLATDDDAARDAVWRDRADYDIMEVVSEQSEETYRSQCPAYRIIGRYVRFNGQPIALAEVLR